MLKKKLPKTVGKASPKIDIIGQFVYFVGKKIEIWANKLTGSTVFYLIDKIPTKVLPKNSLKNLPHVSIDYQYGKSDKLTGFTVVVSLSPG